MHACNMLNKEWKPQVHPRKRRSYASNILKFAALLFIGYQFILYLISSPPIMRSCKQRPSAENNPHCIPLKPNKYLEQVEVNEVNGKFMAESETEREKFDFLLQPRPIVPPTHQCKIHPDLVKWNMVIMVKSAINNAQRRNAIRETWGNVKLLNYVRFEVIFLIGTTDKVNIQHKLEQENAAYGDILQIKIKDTSKTVPEKVLAGMQWSADNLPDHWIYSSIDDDFAVHLINIIDFLNTLYTPIEETSNLRACYEDSPLVCVYSYQARDATNRDPTSKWYMSKTIYPDKYWPKYCRGGMYVMPVRMVNEIYKVSRRTEYLYLDDVWITGLMRRKLGEGDCNIMPAPNSERINLMLMFNIWNWNPLVHHFWGNTTYSANNIAAALKSQWRSWEYITTSLNTCKLSYFNSL